MRKRESRDPVQFASKLFAKLKVLTRIISLDWMEVLSYLPDRPLLLHCATVLLLSGNEGTFARGDCAPLQ